MPVADGVPRAYRNETQLSEQEVPTVAAMFIDLMLKS